MWTVWSLVNNSGNREGKASSGVRISCLWSLLGEISFLCRALMMVMRKISRNFNSHHYNWSPKFTFRTTASKIISWNLEKYMTFNTFSFYRKSFLQCVLMNLCVFSWTKPHSSVGKESPCNAGDPCSVRGTGQSPGGGIGYPPQYSWISLVAQLVENLPAMWETWVRFLGWEDPWRRERLPTPVFWLGEFPGVAKSRTWLSDFHFHFQCKAVF